jgi:hypothetical protein
MEEFQDLRDDGWEGYIAPEAHGPDKGAGDQWVWDVPNPGLFLEAAYDVAPHDLATVVARYDLHRGQGWQFPIIFVFNEEPSSSIVAFLAGTRRTPYIVPYADDPVDEVPNVDEDPYDESHWEEFLNEVVSVYDEARDLRANWKAYGRKRALLRARVIRPLDEAIDRVIDAKQS